MFPAIKSAGKVINMRKKTKLKKLKECEIHSKIMKEYRSDSWVITIKDNSIRDTYEIWISNVHFTDIELMYSEFDKQTELSFDDFEEMLKEDWLKDPDQEELKSAVQDYKSAVLGFDEARWVRFLKDTSGGQTNRCIQTSVFVPTRRREIIDKLLNEFALDVAKEEH